MNPYYQDDFVTLFHGRCEEVLPTLDQVDHVITDPPYSEHVHSRSRAGASLPDVSQRVAGIVKAHVSRSRDLGFDALTPEVRDFCAGQFARLATRWVLVFADVESVHHWKDALTEQRLEHVRTGLWIKEGATPQFTGDRPAAGAEAIEIAHRPGRKKWNGGGSHAVWSVPIVLNRSGNDPRLHTAQKPLALLKRLVSLFTDDGETILDPFAGSGTTGAAAALLGRKAILVEMSEQYCEVIADRLQKIQMQGVMDFGAAV
jgi:site-specific DNA-methyltransferase (adenine-specific)